MEIGNYTQSILRRVQEVEPENATKIFGYLLLHYTLEELKEYAMGDEEQIHSLVSEAKSYFISSPKPKSSEHFHPFISQNHTFHPPFPSSSIFRSHPPLHHAFNQQHLVQNNEFDLQGDFYFPDPVSASRNRFQLNCHYFYKGYCKHGESCKFSHGQNNPDIINQMSGIGLNDSNIEENMLSHGCLEELEMEIGEILRLRRGLPVTIASLPMLYEDMYGKTLQAEGYFDESQRHAKAGFSLTKLIAQLRNVRLIDRPHGQHFVVLAEDVPRYVEFKSERNEYGPSSSHQIYLTFPAESTFTDADVQNYFNQFGPVHDVRIPRQEKRMFGFVSFCHPQTVRQILAIGHPHIICGARVLVKPYKEKSRLAERKYEEKLDAQMYLYPLSFDMGQRTYDTSQFPIKQQIENFHPTFDLKGRQMQVTAHPFLGYDLEDFRKLEAQFSSLNIASHNNLDDDNTGKEGSNFSDLDRLQIQLPDSPFEFSRCGSNSLYTVT